jgi:hypothetical protein
MSRLLSILTGLALCGPRWARHALAILGVLADGIVWRGR